MTVFWSKEHYFKNGKHLFFSFTIHFFEQIQAWVLDISINVNFPLPGSLLQQVSYGNNFETLRANSAMFH